MAAELWLLRHGDAVGQAPSGRDADRELTARGEAQARAAGSALRRLEVDFAAVYTSPKVRAYETARLACEAMGIPEPIVHPPLREDFSASDALALVRSVDGDRVLVVGHNPDFAQVVFDVAGGRVAFKKGGVAALAVREGELLVLLRPHELRRLA
ncbi:MAG: phosphohistidine phosphatase [Thermoleophilaceae bacterium]|nr:phosphohistidine phosphatase [Thermoleophilaceae bacterium]